MPNDIKAYLPVTFTFTLDEGDGGSKYTLGMTVVTEGSPNGVYLNMLQGRFKTLVSEMFQDQITDSDSE